MRTLTKAATNNRSARVAGGPHSLEAVEHLCGSLESVTPELPSAVRDYLAAVRAWASHRRSERVLSCEGMVRHIAHHKFGWRLEACRIDFEDAVQEAMLGLTHAADLFDERRKLCFTTYATYWIRQSLQRMLDNAGLIRTPIDRTVGEKYKEDVGRARRVLRLSEAGSKNPEDDSSPGECMVVDRSRCHCDLWETETDVKDLLRCLDARYRLVVELRYLVGLTLDEIGQELGNRGYEVVSKERVRQMLKKATQRMRAR